MHADHCSRVAGAQLDEIAELVDQPDTARAGLVPRRPSAADERIGDATGVRDLADELGVVVPDSCRAVSAAVNRGVRRRLVGGEASAAIRAGSGPAARA